MSDMIENIRDRWFSITPEERIWAWSGLTEKERQQIESTLEPPAPSGCLQSLFLPKRANVPAATTTSNSRLRLATSAYELELSNLSGDEFQAALDTVMLLVQGSAEIQQADATEDPGEQERFLRGELMQHRTNINKLNLQLAVYAAGEAPLHLLNQLEDEQSKVAELERQLDAMHVDDDYLE